MAPQSLEDLLRTGIDPVQMLRNAPVGAYTYPISYPVVTHEFSNWRDEQRAWRESCAFFDLSHHMVDLFMRGPDTGALVELVGINSFAKFPVDRAKQLVTCSPDGYVLGDGILFHLDEGSYEFVGRATVINWLKFHAAEQGFDVEFEQDERSPARPQGRPVVRKQYRYQLQGPHAEALLEKLNGGPLPQIRFFNMDWVNIGPHRVRALRHGMSGQPGLEIFGPYDQGEAVLETIFAAGEEFGIRHVGARTYATDTLESGWIPSPMPAVYTGESMRPFRETIPADGPEGTHGSLAGSFVSDNIADYYLTPYELGYGSFVRFDHDFIGRDALEAMDTSQQRRKATLAWNAEDVTAIHASLLQDEQPPYKHLEFPLANYAAMNYDRIERDGELAGFSMYTGYSFNERSVLSLAVIDADIDVGTEVTVVWGEPDGGTDKHTVEKPHRQLAVRATVAPVPFSKDAREHYAEGWRTQQNR